MIANNIALIRERFIAAALRAGRDPNEITLVAVTKTVPRVRMREAFEAGIRDFGESYYQEWREKADHLDESIRWHFIGHVQSNKTRYLTGRFALIHSVDSVELARALGERAMRQGGVQPILLEVKLDPAETKFGISLESCVDIACSVSEIKGLDLRGFMGMAPYGQDPEMSRPRFRRLQQQFSQLPDPHRKALSMGMTGDFEVAIEEGATHVRVGTAIFGARDPAKT